MDFYCCYDKFLYGVQVAQHVFRKHATLLACATGVATFALVACALVPPYDKRCAPQTSKRHVASTYGTLLVPHGLLFEERQQQQQQQRQCSQTTALLRTATDRVQKVVYFLQDVMADDYGCFSRFEGTYHASFQVSETIFGDLENDLARARAALHRVAHLSLSACDTASAARDVASVTQHIDEASVGLLKLHLVYAVQSVDADRLDEILRSAPPGAVRRALKDGRLLRIVYRRVDTNIVRTLVRHGANPMQILLNVGQLPIDIGSWAVFKYLRACAWRRRAVALAIVFSNARRQPSSPFARMGRYMCAHLTAVAVVHEDPMLRHAPDVTVYGGAASRFEGEMALVQHWRTIVRMEEAGTDHVGALAMFCLRILA